MAFNPDDIKVEGTVSAFAHLTRSLHAQRLMELETQGSGSERPTMTIPFEGTADQAHEKTRSLRRTMARHGYRLYYRREDTQLRLWAVKDPTIDRTAYISKPRRHRPFG